MNVALFGATGFVGSYLVDALLAAGHEPSVLVRPGSAGKLRDADRCRVVPGDVGDEAAIRALLDDCGAVIYCIGLLREFPRQGVTFEETHVAGVRRSARLAAEAGIDRYLLMSANGVDAERTPYQASKRRGERLLEASGLDYTIFRPSFIFGDPRGRMEIATQLYTDLVRPPLPAVGFRNGLLPTASAPSMSPVHAADVAAAFVAALDDPATHGSTVALGGPEVITWSQMIERIAAAAGRSKWIVPMPIGLMRLAAAAFDWLPIFPVSRDQLTMLAQGSAVPPDALAALLGRRPRAFSAESLSYLRGGSGG